MASRLSHRNICRLRPLPRPTVGSSSRPQAKGCRPAPASPCIRYREPAVMTADREPPHRNAELLATVRSAARQEQFLKSILPEEARRRFDGATDRSPLAAETVRITQALGRVLASDLAAETDVPAFDRASVDGFAVRAADTIGAGDRAPRQLLLNAEVIASGHPPALEVRAGTASAIATGGAVPRGADAVVMIEHTGLT